MQCMQGSDSIDLSRIAAQPIYERQISRHGVDKYLKITCGCDAAYVGALQSNSFVVHAKLDFECFTHELTMRTGMWVNFRQITT
jgi:hypothetical protein